MALSITPGYDFTTNEVPTNALLKLMLDNASISGIPRTLIDTNLIATLHGHLTGNTMVSLPAEGWLLVDNSGRIWVKTATGPCPIYRPGFGGYETVRFKAGNPTDGVTLPQGGDTYLGTIQSLSAANQDPDLVYWRLGETTPVDSTQMMSHTTVSGAHTRLIMCGSRRVFIQTASRADDKFEYMYKKVVIASNMNPTPFPAVNSDAEGLGAKVGIMGPEDSNNSRAPAWLFGVSMMQQ